jgi:hypothetical protein
MGIVDNYLQRKGFVKKEDDATVLDAIDKLNQTVQTQSTIINGSPLVPMNAGIPLTPNAINHPNAEGNTEPRKWEFLPTTNININDRLIPFKILRQCAEQIDILARCINLKKSKALGWDWDIALSPDATDKIARERGVNRERAALIAREEYGDEISRIKEFWKNPDPINGLSFIDWFGIVLDEVLTVDALAIYPLRTYGDELVALQIIDGATIKPIIDDRGMRPEAPNTAFQQILYGFPRADFAPPIEDESADGVFDTNELFYAVQNRRTTSSYGQSPTERALALADIYIRRQDWMRKEYTDGVTPDIFMKTDAQFGNDPARRTAFEQNLNDELAGQTSARVGVKLLPAGFDPVQMAAYAERFKDVLDDFLMGAIASHYALQPTEIGLIPKHAGLGGAGLQKGQAESSVAIGDVPLQRWFAEMFSKLSYLYLGAPRELEFIFTNNSRDDVLANAQADDINLKNGKITLNAARAKAGEPLIDSPQADQPMMITNAGGFFFTEDGIAPIADVATPETVTPEGVVTNTQDPNALADNEDVKTDTNDVMQPTDKEKALLEMQSCVRWLRKSPTRPFNFEFARSIDGEVINKFVGLGDYESARWFAERYIP